MNRLMTTVRTGRLALACAGLLLWTSGVSAQAVSVPSLKAAFLMNFVKFADWPDDAVAPGRVFTFCVAGDKAVLQALASTKQSPRPEVMFVTADGPFNTCQLLYLGGMDLRQSGRILESIKGAPVFTVSDADGFAEMGGVAQLRIEKGQMRFLINHAAAQRARIALSVKLLTLATIVKDGSNAVR